MATTKTRSKKSSSGVAVLCGSSEERGRIGAIHWSADGTTLVSQAPDDPVRLEMFQRLLVEQQLQVRLLCKIM